MAGADVASAHDAERLSLGPMGTRPANATPLAFVDDAGAVTPVAALGDLPRGGHPRPLRQAHVRRCQRHRQRRARGQPPPHVVVALARALVAWMGAMATPVPVTSSRWRRQGPGLEPPTGSPGTVPQAIGRSAAPGWGPPSTA